MALDATSVIRLAASSVAGFVATELVRLGVHVDNATVAAVLTSAFSVGYYSLVSFVETKYAKAGWFLLAKKVVDDVKNPPAAK